MKLDLNVNGEDLEVDVSGSELLSDVLRSKLNLTGVKEGCREGECGACTVLMDDMAVNSCLVLAIQATGRKTVTVEGLARQDALDKIQEAFVEHGAIQCGYCSPGMIMAAKALLLREPRPTRHAIRDALAGNLCRCTGYLNIIKAIEAALLPPRDREERL
ncbi:MAG: (2Fe-2S)-binding protein [Rhodospirillales bacterium]|jgi:carbon-monoxide dehydrogenase small subunit|nr:(2Fe-2S)-binding protein [Rhodospirillales bacterium]HJO72972.1 (2Fe-2S)-binding protein [Rhodospirillales bacterium]